MKSVSQSPLIGALVPAASLKSSVFSGYSAGGFEHVGKKGFREIRCACHSLVQPFNLLKKYNKMDSCISRPLTPRKQRPETRLCSRHMTYAVTKAT